MVEKIVEFSRLLRARGVRVSLAETTDAVRALRSLCAEDLPQFRSALRCALVKRPSDFAVFEELFDGFFLGLGNYLAVVGEPAAPAVVLDQGALGEIIERIAPLLSAGDDEISLLARALLAGEWERVDDLVARALREEGPNRPGTPAPGGHSQRIVARLGVTRLIGEFEALRARAAKKGLEARLAERLADYLNQQLRHLIRRIHGAVRSRWPEEAAGSPAAGAERLQEKSFAYYTQEDIRKMREVVAQLALRFKSVLSLRQRRRARGRLDVKKTLRQNQQYGGVPFRVHLRRRKKEKPQVMVLCDISDSVANAARFMLQFVYSVQELYAKVRSFVFVSDLGEVTQLFSDHPIDRAVEAALKGDVIDVFSHSNFGRSFKIFHDHHLHAVNRKTTVVILGDGRNNYHPPNDWVLGEIRQRAKRLLWLNPESRVTWGVGDSEMPRYMPHCHQVEECRNIEQLARIVGRLAP